MDFPLALIGGEEFADGFEDVHARLAEIAVNSRDRSNGQPLKVVFLPTCAAHDGLETVEYWCEQARQRLGAQGAQVFALPVVDQTSANHPEHARRIAEADWVYIGGGYPHVGLGILAGTRALDALHQARRNGALIAGASAGAMLLCDRSWVITPEFDEAVTEMISMQANPDETELPMPPFLDCLGFLPGTLLWPHFNQFFSMKWIEGGIVPPGITVIGVDEQTAVVRNQEGSMQVLGKGRVVIIGPDLNQQVYLDGAQFSLNRVNA
jgi:cyanophycinase